MALFTSNTDLGHAVSSAYKNLGRVVRIPPRILMTVYQHEVLVQVLLLRGEDIILTNNSGQDKHNGAAVDDYCRLTPARSSYIKELYNLEIQLLICITQLILLSLFHYQLLKQLLDYQIQMLMVLVTAGSWTNRFYWQKYQRYSYSQRWQQK